MRIFKIIMFCLMLTLSFNLAYAAYFNGIIVADDTGAQRWTPYGECSCPQGELQVRCRNPGDSFASVDWTEDTGYEQGGYFNIYDLSAGEIVCTLSPDPQYEICESLLYDHDAEEVLEEAETCESLGHGSGDLICHHDCIFDWSDCSGISFIKEKAYFSN